MSSKYHWLEKKTPRSVDQLRLWPDNPRLNPEETHVTLRDFAEDLTDDNADRNDFYALINSIVTDGFVPADPIVIWKNLENEKYYVAEGNRRVAALKLLRNPEKAPKPIRSFIRKSSQKIDLEEIEKILVNVAPTFEDAEWYINQRNSSSSLQRSWSRVQQQRWILKLYEKHDGNLEKIISITKLSKSELEGFFRILKIKDFVKLNSVKSKLTTEEFEKADSYRFPVTILERFFNFIRVRKDWGIEFEGLDVKITSNKETFYNAYAELIKRVVNKSDNNINTRINKDNLDAILGTLPKVSFEIPDDSKEEEEEVPSSEHETDTIPDSTPDTEPTTDVSPPKSGPLKGDLNRNKILLNIYDLNTDSYRLSGLFNEFKHIPVSRYPNAVSSSLRVFLDLAVLKYIETEGLEGEISASYKMHLKEIYLKKRLEYLKSKISDNKIKKIISRLIDPNTEYSLDVLNGYVHGKDSHYTTKNFLNGFWDFLFPLFESLLEINEHK